MFKNTKTIVILNIKVADCTLIIYSIYSSNTKWMKNQETRSKHVCAPDGVPQMPDLKEI